MSPTIGPTFINGGFNKNKTIVYKLSSTVMEFVYNKVLKAHPAVCWRQSYKRTYKITHIQDDNVYIVTVQSLLVWKDFSKFNVPAKSIFINFYNNNFLGTFMEGITKLDFLPIQPARPIKFIKKIV